MEALSVLSHCDKPIPMASLHQHILAELASFYRPEEFPVLRHQCAQWEKTRPLDGLKVLDATPHFRNTYAKYAALIAAGARLSIAIGPTLPHDPEALLQAQEFGIPVISPSEAIHSSFDLVLDCAGILAEVPAAIGYAELTRSGVARYTHAQSPVWVVDSGRIKQIETCLGTGDGFVRAMANWGYSLQKRRLIVFGYGKVGRGIVLMALRQGAEVTVVDIDTEVREHLPPGVGFIPLNAREQVRQAVVRAFCAVTATGVLHALEEILSPGDLQSPVLLANMGVEDEWGPSVPAERVLNAKQPANFSLKDPTLMRYIDPPMALHNAGALELARGGIPRGLHPPSPSLEISYGEIIRRHGLIGKELSLVGL